MTRMYRILATLFAAAAVPATLAAQHDHQHPAPAPRPSAVTPPAPAAAAAPCTHAGAPSRMGQQGMMHMGDMAGMPVMMDSMMPAMHAMHAFAPERLLEHASHLELSVDQRDRLDAIRGASRAPLDSARAALGPLTRSFSAAIGQAGADPAAVESRFAALHAAMGQQHLVELRAAIRARAVLTEAQRVRADGMYAAMCRS